MAAALPQVVWFKRDLRLADHAPLAQVAGRGPVLALWLDEPEAWAQPDAAPRHRAWALGCAADLDAALRRRGGRLLVLAMPALQALDRLRLALGRFDLWSHEETGNGWSFDRDRAVQRWCRAHGIAWTQCPNSAVVRRLPDRDRWSVLWHERMAPPPLAPPDAVRWLPWPAVLQALALDPGWLAADAAAALPVAAGAPGRTAARQALRRFFDERLEGYRAGMASPLVAPDVCSRLSAHIAWGTVSVRELLHAVWDRRRALLARPAAERPAGALAGLKSFESRLHWRDHFIQKLESEPALEWRNLHRGHDGLRNEGALSDVEQARLDAWMQGRTGWPFVDACMRCLNATGWLNFRMRAMLMSVAAYPLWLHWRAPGLHLARQFTDYEPGIHWPQCQMQSGTTGINATRIYNPVRQGLQHDPLGVFTRRWLPELAGVDDLWLHQPWQAPQPPRGYPPPIADLQPALREAAARVHALRATDAARQEAAQVYRRHGSRHPGREGRGSGQVSPARDAGAPALPPADHGPQLSLW